MRDAGARRRGFLLCREPVWRSRDRSIGDSCPMGVPGERIRVGRIDATYTGRRSRRRTEGSSLGRKGVLHNYRSGGAYCHIEQNCETFLKQLQGCFVRRRSLETSQWGERESPRGDAAVHRPDSHGGRWEPDDRGKAGGTARPRRKSRPIEWPGRVEPVGARHRFAWRKNVESTYSGGIANLIFVASRALLAAADYTAPGTR